MKEKHILIVAGEASGDLYGAQLVSFLKEKHPEMDFFGIGGPELRKAGLRSLFKMEELSVVGLFEAFSKIPKLWKALRSIEREINRLPVHLSILIDFPGFNLYLAKKLKKWGIPVLYYVSPQIWAWWSSRAKRLKECVDRLAVILPFEVEFFKNYGIEALFVGHPQREIIEKAPSREEARTSLGIDSDQKVIGLFPGSRRGEVKRHLKVMVKTVELLRRDFPDLKALLALAPGLSDELFQVEREIKVIKNDPLRVMAASDLLIVASGTVTLQGALMGKRMMVIYKVNALSYFLAKALVKVSFIALPNLLLGRMVFPELIQREANPFKLAEVAKNMLLDENKEEELIFVSRRLKELLPSGAPERVAKIALELMR